MESNLTSKPDWLSYYPNANKPTQNVNFGFDGTGMYFKGDSGSGDVAYPIRTNFDIVDKSKATVIFSFEYGDQSGSTSAFSDQGICFFKSAGAPEWVWNSYNSTRLAVQFDGNVLEVNGPNVATTLELSLSIGNTYTCKVEHDPKANTTLVAVFDGPSASGVPMDFVSVNDSIQGNYRIGFDADKDAGDGTESSYFTYLYILSSANANACSYISCTSAAFKCLNVDATCTCAKMKVFYPQCSKAQIASGTCFGNRGAYVAAITVCNQRLF